MKRAPVASIFTRRRARPNRRWPFVVIGLTGSIAMGKSTAAAMLRRFRWPIFDADAAVHRLIAGPARSAIAAAFPEALGPAGIDRQALARAVFGNASALRRLEHILHPLVAAARHGFFRGAALHRVRAVVLDVPLLFEGGGDIACDLVVVASAPPFLQRQRALRRTGMTFERLDAILDRQTADHLKRRQASLVAPSGLGKRETLHRLMRLRKMLRAFNSL